MIKSKIGCNILLIDYSKCHSAVPELNSDTLMPITWNEFLFSILEHHQMKGKVFT